MQINSIDNTNFGGGKFRKSSKIKDGTDWFVNRIINERINGITNQQLLDEKTFDVLITTGNTKKTKTPFLRFKSSFKVLDNDNLETKRMHIINDGASDDNILSGALKLRQHIQAVDKQKKNNNGFNTVGEKIRQLIRVLWGI